MNEVRKKAAAFKQQLRAETLSLIISLRKTIDEGVRLLDMLGDIELIAHKADDLYQDISNDIINHGSKMDEIGFDNTATMKTDEKETPPEVCDTSNGSDCCL